MKKILTIILIFALMASFGNNVFAQSKATSWYCIRKKDHTQPSLASEMDFAKCYDLFWCDEKNNDFTSGEKVIYLTFDAGYENGNVEKIVNILNDEGVKATFFVLDNLILKNESLVRKMIDSGHLIGNHTMKHKDMTKFTKIEDFEKELSLLENLYEKTFGEKMKKVYRPPEGKINEENLVWAKELGYKTVMWSFAYADWDNNKQPSCDFAMGKILDNLHNGEIMLLHPTSETNAEIMKELIQKLKSLGYRFATVDELWEK